MIPCPLKSIRIINQIREMLIKLEKIVREMDTDSTEVCP